jgi:hypothetical protein
MTLQKRVFGLVGRSVAGQSARGGPIKKPVWAGPSCLTSGLVGNGSVDGLGSVANTWPSSQIRRDSSHDCVLISSWKFPQKTRG